MAAVRQRAVRALDRGAAAKGRGPCLRDWRALWRREAAGLGAMYGLAGTDAGTLGAG